VHEAGDASAGLDAADLSRNQWEGLRLTAAVDSTAPPALACRLQGAPYGRSGAPYSALYVSVPFSLPPDLACHYSSP
jgi:hypothetical protein